MRVPAPQKNPIRNFFLILTRSSYFSMFMMANIIVNFIILAAYDPLHDNMARGYGSAGQAAMTPQDKVQSDLEPWFQAVSGAPLSAPVPALALPPARARTKPDPLAPAPCRFSPSRR